MGDTSRIISIFRTKVNEKNIDRILKEMIKHLNEQGKDADKYNSSFGLRTFRIGSNQIERMMQGGFYSSDKEFISNNIRLNVMSGIAADEVNLTMGDCTEAYISLIKRIQKLDDLSFDSIMKAVYMATKDFFGGIENVDGEKRKKYYLHLGDMGKEGKVSDLKGKNIAACVERAALSQNLLHLLGIDSVYKTSQVKNAESTEVHAYNLVAYEGKYYIFDATIPRIDEKGEITPIITEISKEDFEKLSHPLHEDDVSVKTEFDSVRGHRKIHYNSWSKNVVDKTPKTNDSSDEPEIE